MAEVWFVPDKVAGGSKRISVTKDDCMPLSQSIITGGPGACYCYVTEEMGVI